MIQIIKVKSRLKASYKSLMNKTKADYPKTTSDNSNKEAITPSNTNFPPTALFLLINTSDSYCTVRDIFEAAQQLLQSYY